MVFLFVFTKTEIDWLLDELLKAICIKTSQFFISLKQHHYQKTLFLSLSLAKKDWSIHGEGIQQALFLHIGGTRNCMHIAPKRPVCLIGRLL